VAATINFTAREMADLVFRASLIQGVKEVNQAAGEVTNRKICDATDFDICLIGLMGEAAVAKYLDIPFDHTLTKWGDDGNDLVYRGKTLQVKSSSTHCVEESRRLVFNHVDHLVSDYGVLCVIPSPSSARIVGAIARDEFRKLHHTHDFRFGDRHCVFAKELTPIEVFAGKEQSLEELFA
jgi:hypothetical protein